MSEADKMFKELGLRNQMEKIKIADNFDNYYIEFNLTQKKININGNYINLELLKAINQKCKELGWLDE